MMEEIKNIIFDLGGVVVTLSPSKAIEKFQKLGLKDADKILDSYTQGGIFGELEIGKIDDNQFVEKLSVLCGRKLTYEQCLDAWLGYRKELPARNLRILKELRKEGYRLILLSNTNPFMMQWASSNSFDGNGNSIDFYFDSIYTSYTLRVMKPDPDFFRQVMLKEGIFPQNTLFVDDGPKNIAVASELGMRTFCPINGEDWTHDIRKYLTKDNNTTNEKSSYIAQYNQI